MHLVLQTAAGKSWPLLIPGTFGVENSRQHGEVSRLEAGKNEQKTAIYP
jgi:hypothetical protein